MTRAHYIGFWDRIKYLVPLVLALVSYIGLSRLLFFANGFLESALFFVILSGALFYLILARQDKPLHQWLLPLGIATVVVWVWAARYLDNLTIFLSVIFFNLGILSLVYYGQDELHNSIKVSSRSYFSSGGWYIWGVALAYATAFLAHNATFTLTCQDINNRSSESIHTATSPFMSAYNTFLEGKNYVIHLSQQTLGDTLGIPTGTTVALPAAASTSPLMQSRPMSVLSQILSDNSNVSRSTCDLTLNLIKERYAQAGFQTSLIVLLFIVGYPVIRILMYIISAVLWLVFEFLLLVRFYKKVPEDKTVTKIR